MGRTWKQPKGPEMDAVAFQDFKKRDIHEKVKYKAE